MPGAQKDAAPPWSKYVDRAGNTPWPGGSGVCLTVVAVVECPTICWKRIKGLRGWKDLRIISGLDRLSWKATPNGGFDSIVAKRPRTGLFLVPSLIIILLLAITPVAFAQTLDQQKADAQKEVSALQQKLEDSVERYNYACVKLEETRSRIDENKVQLTEAEQSLAKNKARLSSRIRAMYVTHQYRFVDVVVSSDNFDEFLVGLDLAKKIGQRDAQLVTQVKQAKAQLEQARAGLQEQKAEQEAARKEISDAKAAVENDLSGAQGKLSNVESQIRAAMEQRMAQSTSRSSSSSSRTSTAPADTVARRSRPPGAPHGGVVGVAYDQLGKPYVWGAAGPDCFDCSGLTMYCYEVGAGISISHSSYAQADCGVAVSVGELQPGDIVGFRGWGHVGLYVGGDSFIHAPQSGDVVKVSSLSARTNFCGAVRP